MNLAQAFTSGAWPNTQAEANARLIAAAPELLEACRAILTLASSLKNWDAIEEQVQASIVRAEGRRP